MEPIQVVYYLLPVLGGHVGIPVTLATIFFAPNQTKRHPTFISFLISWIVFATSDLVLLYSGEEITSPSKPPDHSLCLFQACMIYARFVLVALTSLTLAFTMWLEIRDIRVARDSYLIYALLIWTPWVTFSILLMASAIYGSLNPTATATEGIFYCNFVTNNVAYFVTCITLACQIVAVYIEAAILRIIWKASRQFKQEKRSICHLCIRMAVFTAYSFVTLIISLLITFTPRIMGLYVFLASLPFAAFFIFGTQRENLCVWFGSCIPSLKTPCAGDDSRRRGPPKRAATRELSFDLSPSPAKLGTLEAGFSVIDISPYLDKRTPRTPTVIDES